MAERVVPDSHEERREIALLPVTHKPGDWRNPALNSFVGKRLRKSRMQMIWHRLDADINVPETLGGKKSKRRLPHNEANEWATPYKRRQWKELNLICHDCIMIAASADCAVWTVNGELYKNLQLDPPGGPTNDWESFGQLWPMGITQ